MREELRKMLGGLKKLNRLLIKKIKDEGFIPVGVFEATGLAVLAFLCRAFASASLFLFSVWGALVPT